MPQFRWTGHSKGAENARKTLPIRRSGQWQVHPRQALPAQQETAHRRITRTPAAG